MKEKNVKIGMKVVVKPNADGKAGSYIGKSGTVVQSCVFSDVWYLDIDGDPVIVASCEIRKFKIGVDE